MAEFYLVSRLFFMVSSHVAWGGIEGYAFATRDTGDIVGMTSHHEKGRSLKIKNKNKNRKKWTKKNPHSGRQKCDKNRGQQKKIYLYINT